MKFDSSPLRKEYLSSIDKLVKKNPSKINNKPNKDDLLILTEKDFKDYNINNEKCNGFTLKGKQCTNKAIKSKKYCKKHIQKFRLEKPEECAICCESLEDTHLPLSCSHWIHRNCIIKWGKDQCPICRQKIKISTAERKKMKQNGNNIDNEEIEEEIEFPQGFMEYLQLIIRSISNNFDVQLNEETLQQFFIIDVNEEN